MKKIYLFALLISFLSGSAEVIEFNDFNFKSLLLAANVNNATAQDVNGHNIKIDINNDQEIETEEALLVYKLSQTTVFGVNDFTGIGYFSNIKDLRLAIPFNVVLNLDLTGLTNLEKLYLGAQSRVENLNVSGLTHLKEVNCSNVKMRTINISGAMALQKLWCDNNELTQIDLSGLTSLTNVNCALNDITSLDLSGLTNLEVIMCSNNRIATMNLSGLTHLIGLHCNANELTTLDVSGIPSLELLNCQLNNLSQLQVHGLSHLNYLDCISNNLTMIDFTGLDSLESLYCALNHLSSVNVKHLSNLKEFTCGQNNLTTLDVSGLGQLNKFACFNNQLASIYMKGIAFNGGTEDIFGINDNPNLQYICTDEGKIELIRTYTAAQGYVNCVIDSSCELNTTSNTATAVVLYPNPADQQLNIALNGMRRISSIVIFDNLGRIVQMLPESDLKSVIDISALKTGNYFLKINSDKGTTNAKFAKK